MTLAGKTAVVTGGGTGIGAAIALALAAEGCRVAIAGRRLEKLRETATKFSGSPTIESHEVDVTDRTSVQGLFRWANERFGKIDMAMLCAGANIRHRLMSETTPEEWDDLLAINATGAYNCLHAVVPIMRERRDGLIVLVSSVAGKRASRLGGIGYNAAKFALGALGTSIANEEGKNGIRVTTLCPGEVDTPILENRPVPVTDEHRACILQPEDVAAVALMIAKLPPRAHVQELVIKPTVQEYV
ncbi:MAG: SDR family NAD(P)-dependent oxidoreductase [Pirellulales bacterium]|nr:SDR family NAD(P)-dependent oxidoreductase [Pirellulales bacterium]